MVVGFLVFGFLVGITAVAFVLATGGGVMAAIFTYVVAGSFGLVGMAATALWRDKRPRAGTTDGSVPQTSDLT
jgi:O-antigen ligase